MNAPEIHIARLEADPSPGPALRALVEVYGFPRILFCLGLIASSAGTRAGLLTSNDLYRAGRRLRRAEKGQSR